MRRFALVLAALALSLFVAGPASAARTAKCTISVDPAVGSTTDSYRITASGFPPGSFEQLTDVRIDVRRAGDGRFGSIFFLLLFPDAGGSFYLDYHFNYDGEDPLPPLEPGRYLVRAEANGHECVTTASFVVEA